MPKLPEASFDQIALMLLGHAAGCRSAASTAEVWAARHGSTSLAVSAAVLASDAAVAGELYRFFREAAPHEELIRDFIAGLSKLEGGTIPDRAQVAG